MFFQRQIMLFALRRPDAAEARYIERCESKIADQETRRGLKNLIEKLRHGF